MQNILAKKTLLVVKNPVLYSFLIPSTVRFSLVSGNSLSFSTKAGENTRFNTERKENKFDSLSSNTDGIVSQLTNAESFNVVLQIFEKNSQNIKNEHLILMSRMLGRLTRTVDRFENVNQDERLIQLQKLLAENLENFSDHGC